jgi:hypothetical protein
MTIRAVSSRRMRLVVIVPAILAVAGATAAYAQRIWVGGDFGRGFSRMAPRFPEAEDFDGSFLYCRVLYGSVRAGDGGGGWSTDYPGADNNFSVRLAELTRVRVKFDPDRQPHHVVVSLTDPLLYRCPLLFIEDVGSLQFTEEEVRRLRDFLLKGGFLWADDFWGSYSWRLWVREISRVLPPGEYPIFDIPKAHPIMQTLYDVPDIPQVPAISFWRRSRGYTSERGHDSAEVHWRGINSARGRLMVLMSHNTDIADTWEREGEEPRQYFDLFSPRGYAIGVNVVLYAMTH